MSNVTAFPQRKPPPDEPGVVRTLGAHWSAARLGSMPDLSREPEHEYSNQYVVRAAAIVCRGRLNFTCVLPSMRQPALPEYLASHTNDNQETET